MDGWHQYFSSQILERGYNYYQLDLVKIINSSKEFIEANVEGSGFYSLRINLKDGDIKSMYCN